MKDPAHFVTTLEARRYPGTRTRQLLSPLSFYSAEYDETITAAPGFVFDGVSGPTLRGDGEASSGIHDWMYAHPQIYPRDKADKIFKECLKAEGMGWFRRNAWYSALRLFGCLYYGKEDHASPDSTDYYGGA